MIRFAAVALAAVCLFPAVPAFAEAGKYMRSDGFELTIRCRAWGCSVLGKPPDGSWALVEKGPGGAEGFAMLVDKYRKAGFATRAPDVIRGLP